MQVPFDMLLRSFLVCNHAGEYRSLSPLSTKKTAPSPGGVFHHFSPLANPFRLVLSIRITL